MVDIALASLAFSAGMASFFNPCGFAMLPVYISYYFSRQEQHHNLLRRFFSALLIGILASIGFMVVFVFAGIIFSYIGAQFKRFVPYIAASMGGILVIIGLAILFNFKFNIVPAKITNFGDKLKNTKMKGGLGFFVYGVGYATASLGCTFPIFLMIVAGAFSLGNFFDSVLVFVLYALGKGTMMIITTIVIATAKTFTIKYLQGIMRYMYKVSSVIIILAGAYIVYYNWRFVGV